MTLGILDSKGVGSDPDHCGSSVLMRRICVAQTLQEYSARRPSVTPWNTAGYQVTAK